MIIQSETDFIADEFGHIRDVRHLNFSQEAAPSQQRTPATKASSYSGSDSTRANPAQGSGGVLVVPIGLLITIVAIVFRLLGATGDSPELSESAGARSLQLANSYYQNEDFDRAITYYDMAIRENPDLGLAFNNRALAYAAKGEIDRALVDLEAAVRLLPDSALPHNSLGAIHFLMGDLENAIVELDVALSLDPRLAKACFNRGLAHLALGSYDKAVADLNQAIAFTPEFAAKMAAQGSPLSDDLLSNLESTQSFADVPLAYMYRGIAYLKQGDADKAIADFDKAIELRPTLAEAYHSRGLAYLTIGDNDKAMTDFEQSTELGKDPELQHEPEQPFGELGGVPLHGVDSSPGLLASRALCG